MQINTYERVDNARQERDPWDVPEVFEGWRFPEELSVHQVAILEDLATGDNFDAEISDLKTSWGLSRLTANDVITAFVRRRDNDVGASNNQRALLRRMLMALSQSDVPEGFYNHLFSVIVSGNDPTTRAAINEGRAIIQQAKDVGWNVNFKLEQRNTSNAGTAPPPENLDELVEKTF